MALKTQDITENWSQEIEFSLCHFDNVTFLSEGRFEFLYLHANEPWINKIIYYAETLTKRSAFCTDSARPARQTDTQSSPRSSVPQSVTAAAPQSPALQSRLHGIGCAHCGPTGLRGTGPEGLHIIGPVWSGCYYWRCSSS